MNLVKRVEQLEHRVGSENEFLLIVIAAMGCNRDKLGPERVIQYEVTGLSAMGRDRTWIRLPGESVEALTARVEQELQAEGHKVYAVCECYADDLPVC